MVLNAIDSYLREPIRIYRTITDHLWLIIRGLLAKYCYRIAERSGRNELDRHENQASRINR